MRTLRQFLTVHKAYPASLEFRRWSGYRDRDPAADSISYGHQEHAPDLESAHYATCRWLEGSDYNGGALVRANRKAFEVEHGNLAELFVRTSGGHGTEGLLLDLDREISDEALGDDDPETLFGSFLETLRGLDNYPVIDEEALSEEEREDEEKAWASYARKDFEDELSKSVGLDRGDLDFPDDSARELFYVADGGTGLVEHAEDGASFDVEKAAERVSPAVVFFAANLDRDFLDGVELAQEDEGEALRLLRMVKVGKTLRAIVSRTAALLARDSDPENGTSADRMASAVYSVSDCIRRAKFDVGDALAPLDRASLENKPQRSFGAVFVANEWKAGKYETRSLEMTIDPMATDEIYEHAEKLAAFLKFRG